MVERHDFIPLARGASLAHDQLFPDQDLKESKALDIIALALSVLIPLYHRDPESDSLRALTESELASGRFTRGATTLEFATRAPLRSLDVSREQLHAAIGRRREDALSAGRVSLTRRQMKTPGKPGVSAIR
jgi:hypothetical protein